MEIPRPTGTEVNWLLLDLNSFFASCEQQADPDLRGRPVGVVPMMGVDTTCLLAASREAKRFGLRTGTPVGEAKERCPDLVLLPACHKKYLYYHKRVIETLESCTPIEHVLSIDEMACRLTGSQRDPDNATALALKIKQAIRDNVGECLTSSIGIAPNILLAKLGSDMQKPDGLVVIRPCDLPHKILHLKPRDFSGIGPRMEKRLQHAGIFNMHDLYACDRRQLRAIWGGVEGARFHAKIWGHDLQREATNKSVIGHQHVLEPSLRTIAGSTNVLQHLLIKGAERLRQNNLYCKRLGVHVKMDRHAGYWARDTDFTETQDTLFLLQILQGLWRDYPGNRPLRVGITLSGLRHAENHQMDLFEKQKPTHLLQAVDVLNQRFGRHTISFGLNSYVQEKVGRDKIAFQRVPEERHL